MSGPGVLAVLDAAYLALYVRAETVEESALAESVLQARITATGLIDALDYCVAVLRGVDSDTGDEVDRAARRGKAALANVGGVL